MTDIELLQIGAAVEEEGHDGDSLFGGPHRSHRGDIGGAMQRVLWEWPHVLVEKGQKLERPPRITCRITHAFAALPVGGDADQEQAEVALRVTAGLLVAGAKAGGEDLFVE